MHTQTLLDLYKKKNTLMQALQFLIIINLLYYRTLPPYNLKFWPKCLLSNFHFIYCLSLLMLVIYKTISILPQEKHSEATFTYKDVQVILKSDGKNK